MKKRYKSGLVVSALTTAALLVGSTAFAAHPNVTLRNSNGVIDSLNANQAYSPRLTCGYCHTEVVDEGVDDAADRHGPVGSYDGGGDFKQVSKTQGVINDATGEVEWVSFTTKAYKHGFSVGRHSQQGRNEEYGNEMRHAVHGKFWANSPGMFGKY